MVWLRTTALCVISCAVSDNPGTHGRLGCTSCQREDGGGGPPNRWRAARVEADAAPTNRPSAGRRVLSMKIPATPAATPTIPRISSAIANRRVVSIFPGLRAWRFVGAQKSIAYERAAQLQPLHLDGALWRPEPCRPAEASGGGNVDPLATAVPRWSQPPAGPGDEEEKNR